MSIERKNSQRVSFFKNDTNRSPLKLLDSKLASRMAR